MKSIMTGIMTAIMRCCFGSPADGVRRLCSVIVAAIATGRMFRPPNGNHSRKSPSGAERSATQSHGAKRSSTLERSTVKSAMNTGSWISIGRQLESGFTWFSA